jgi:aryl-alcohol dehydrogenase-like predicted oxidoreductase
MERRMLGRTGRRVSVVGLGTWQLGADWGHIDDDEALAILETSLRAGVTFYDTADVYGDGRSERLIGQFRARHPDQELFVATKLGRRAARQELSEYTLERFRAWTDRSRANVGVDTLDLVQLHCPPTAVFGSDRVYEALDTLVQEKRIAAYGVSVETCAQALTAIGRPHVTSVQVILNVFRRKPLEEVLPAARAAGVGIIVRVPLASGLLSGTFTRDSTFGPDDHRTYNRRGEYFDVGETFSGVDYDAGVAAAAAFAALVPVGMTPAQAALRWVIQQPGVTTVIPGATTARQRRTPRWPGCRSSPRPNSPRSRGSTTSASEPRSITAGDGSCLRRRGPAGRSGPRVRATRAGPVGAGGLGYRGRQWRALERHCGSSATRRVVLDELHEDPPR